MIIRKAGAAGKVAGRLEVGKQRSPFQFIIKTAGHAVG